MLEIELEELLKREKRDRQKEAEYLLGRVLVYQQILVNLLHAINNEEILDPYMEAAEDVLGYKVFNRDE